NWTTSGTKTIADTVSQNGCSSTGSMQVTVNDVPVSAAGPDVSFCSGDSAAIGTAATAGYNYSWSPLLGLSDATISNPMADLANTSNAAIITNHIVTTSIGNCTSSDTVTVTVYPVPVAGFVDPTGQCLGGNNFAYTAGGSFLPNATFAWNFGLNASPSTSTSQNQNVSFSAVGNYPVSLTITEGGCVSNTFTASTDVYPSPVLSFPSDPLTGCENFVVCFTNNSTGNGLTYQWSFGDGGSSTQLSPCHTFVAPGVYSVSLSIASVNGCTADTTITDMITVLADPKAIFSASNTVFHFPETTLNLSNQSENAFNYFWTFGKAGNSTVVNPSVTFTDSGTYDIKLYAYNQFGCVDSTDLPVIVYPPTNYFIPNIFTPNGDGNNDFFYIEAQSGVRVIEFQVFNRIGEKVHDGLYPWDGTYQGKPAPEGVYVYIFEIGQAGSDIARHKKGSVTLLR
ncbi:MAG: domain containing protein, partial [Bacteroidota bacterium]|nr:domain containing protein [Bacteroidota bacterium]